MCPRERDHVVPSTSSQMTHIPMQISRALDSISHVAALDSGRNLSKQVIETGDKQEPLGKTILSNLLGFQRSKINA